MTLGSKRESLAKIKQVHSFSNKRWGDTQPLPTDREDPIPKTLEWDLWNGIVEPVTFLKGFYHPGQWRRRIPFGTGTLGDMGCHMYNGWFRALSLTAPTSIRAEGTPLGDNWGVDSQIHYQFPGNDFTASDSVEVIWYDGSKRPPKEITSLVEKFPGQGSVYVGEEGILIHPHGGRVQFFKDGKPADSGQEEVIGSAADHWKEFVDSILGITDRKPKSNFDFAAPMTETVLLGNIASFFPGEELSWDVESMRFPGKPEANKHVRRKYRAGWEIEGLS